MYCLYEIGIHLISIWDFKYFTHTNTNSWTLCQSKYFHLIKAWIVWECAVLNTSIMYSNCSRIKLLVLPWIKHNNIYHIRNHGLYQYTLHKHTTLECNYWIDLNRFIECTLLVHLNFLIVLLQFRSSQTHTHDYFIVVKETEIDKPSNSIYTFTKSYFIIRNRMGLSVHIHIPIHTHTTTKAI